MDSAPLSDVLLRLQNHDVAQAVFGGENHALRLHTHHRAVLEVEDKRALLTQEVLGLVPLKQASNGGAFFGSEVDGHFDEVSGTSDMNGFGDFAYAEVEFLEFVVWDVRALGAQVFTRCLFREGLFLSFPRFSVKGIVSVLPKKP